MIKFPSINQFRNLIRHVQNQTFYVGKDENGDAVYDKNRKLPTLNFRGTVKIHGTNAAVVYDVDSDTVTFQSRTRNVTIESDNAGFALYMTSKEKTLRDIFDNIAVESSTKKIVIYGEWAGPGIQKGVAVSEIDRKIFVVFAIMLVDDDPTKNEWIDIEQYKNLIDYPDHGIYHVMTFGTYHANIDFNRPELSQNDLIDMTLEVEKLCPVGKHFGVSGVGEGIVWQCVSENYNDSGSWMKVKGEKHSSSKVKKLAPVDVEAIETMDKFIKSVVTESRLEQGLDHILREQQLSFEMTSIGDFIRWVFNDVKKEEMDTIVENDLDPKKLGGPIAKASKEWFIARLNKDIGL